jgi:hypothetical protein
MIFGTFCVAMGIHVFLMWPETRQKSLEEIELLFDGKVPAWRSSEVKSRFDEEVAELQRQRNEKPYDADLPNEDARAPLEREETLRDDNSVKGEKPVSIEV